MTDAPETIMSAAVMLQGGAIATMPRPARHHTILHSLPEGAEHYATQGFLTSTGRFASREEAATIAVRAGQIEAPKWGSDLYSEDLW